MGLFQLTLHIGQLIHQLYLIFHLSTVGSHKFLIAGFSFGFTFLGFLADFIQLFIEYPVLFFGARSILTKESYPCSGTTPSCWLLPFVKDEMLNLMLSP